MANPLAALAALTGRRRAPEHHCPVCHHPVRPGSDAIRMRGDYYMHLRCATYRVRREARDFTRS